MVFEMLRKGEANAMTTSDLVRLTGLRNARELRAQIARERAKGFLILSSCRGRGGYYLPAEGAEGRAEVERFCNSIRARALNTLRALQSARKALGVLEGQLELSGDVEGRVHCD